MASATAAGAVLVGGTVIAGSLIGSGIDGLLNDPNIQFSKQSSGGSSAGRKKNPTKGESEIWKNFDNVKGQNRKTSGTGKNQRYYEWDYTHNDIEVYDRNNNHLGSMNPTTGEMYKSPAKGRTIRNK